VAIMVDTKRVSSLTQLPDNLNGKKVLLVISHYDDEVLFAGGLLSKLKCKLAILCMHKNYMKRKNPEGYARAFLNVCKFLNAKMYQGNFDSQKAKIVGSKMIEYVLKCAVMARYLSKYKGYDAIITHNAIGEYGHIDHIIVHYACRAAFRNIPVYFFGANLKNADVVVDYDVDDKKRLIDFYKDVWTPDGYPFCYEPETYLRMK